MRRLRCHVRGALTALEYAPAPSLLPRLRLWTRRGLPEGWPDSSALVFRCILLQVSRKPLIQEGNETPRLGCAGDDRNPAMPDWVMSGLWESGSPGRPNPS